MELEQKMTWMQEFWNRIFPHRQDQTPDCDSADVILRAAGNNVAYLSHVLCTMTGHPPTEISYYLSRIPVAIFVGLPKANAIEIANAIQATGATVELRYYNKV